MASKLIRFNRLNTFRTRDKVWILWTQCHIGLEGNKLVDEPAREEARTPLYRPEPLRGLEVKKKEERTILGKLTRNRRVHGAHRGARTQALTEIFEPRQEKP